MSYVVDASVACCWYFEEQHSVSARGLLASAIPLSAPRLIMIEVANVVWQRTRRKEISQGQWPSIMDNLRRSVSILPEDSFIDDALQVAVTIDHPVHDCLYLAASRSLDVRMVIGNLKLLAKLKGTALATIAAHVTAIQGGVH